MNSCLARMRPEETHNSLGSAKHDYQNTDETNNRTFHMQVNAKHACTQRNIIACDVGIALAHELLRGSAKIIQIFCENYACLETVAHLNDLARPWQVGRASLVCCHISI